MKTKLLPLYLRLFLTVGLTALTRPALHADDNVATSTVKLSAPDKPATLRINLPWADIHLTGVDGDAVTVESTVAAHGTQDNHDTGLRRLDEESNFMLSEHDNLVSLTLAGDNPAAGGNNAAYKISLPRTMALDVKTELGGDLTIKDLSGDIEINTTNGDVQLEGLAGSVIVNTMNGAVHANYARAPQKVISLTTMNGEIDLQVPADTKANVQLRTQNGSILTDFDKAKLKTKAASKPDRNIPTVPAVPSTGTLTEVPPTPPNIGGKVITGTLNGGGVDLTLSSMNGKITLRQSNKSAAASTADSKTKDNITVTFQDPDNFTDASDRNSTLTSADVLNELRDYIQQTAAPLLATGSKLTITFLDLDLAGMIRPDRDNIRLMTGTTFPRAHVKFQLLGADGTVVKEGERKLVDLNYQQTITLMNRSDPLGYDKQLLRDWLLKEFPKRR